MKRRVRKIVNFFAFNLLFFAVYLNFIHKDENVNMFSPAENAMVKPAFGDNASTVLQQPGHPKVQAQLTVN